MNGMIDRLNRQEDRQRAARSREYMFFLCLGKNQLLQFDAKTERERELKEKAIKTMNY